MTPAQKSYPLSKYLHSVQRLLRDKIPPVWVHGVITQINLRGRACYLDISEYQADDVKPVAVLSLFLFSSELDQLNAKLAALPQPFTLAKDLKVSLLLQADFYVPQGRFQCKVLDIDPNYTLGELARTRQNILQKLQAEGLLHRNKATVMGRVPLRVGLISAEGSAAYNDFTSTLQKSSFKFVVSFFSARMQGQETEQSVLAGLAKLQQAGDLDAICIVRGGGSKTDLNYFDSEAICRAIAATDIPVLTGIGHEIDQSLADLVAWRACITPTECAQLLVRRCADSWQYTVQTFTQLSHLAQRQLRSAQESLKHFRGSFSLILPQRLLQEKVTWRRNAQGLKQGTRKVIALAQAEIAPLAPRLALQSKSRFAQEQLKVQLLQQRLQAVDPQRILQRGYSISTIDGKIPAAGEVKSGAELHTRYFWGEIKSKVQ